MTEHQNYSSIVLFIDCDLGSCLGCRDMGGTTDNLPTALDPTGQSCIPQVVQLFRVVGCMSQGSRAQVNTV